MMSFFNVIKSPYLNCYLSSSKRKRKLEKLKEGNEDLASSRASSQNSPSIDMYIRNNNKLKTIFIYPFYTSPTIIYYHNK